MQEASKEVSSYYESLFVQILKYVGGRNSNDIQITNEEFHKTTVQNHQYNHHRIKPDQFWAYSISKTANCLEITELIAFIYSILFSNASAEDVFNHMKYAGTFSRNLMSVEAVVAELQIRLNCQMKCHEFFSFIQDEPELIKCARLTEKYNCTILYFLLLNGVAFNFELMD